MARKYFEDYVPSGSYATRKGAQTAGRNRVRNAIGNNRFVVTKKKGLGGYKYNLFIVSRYKKVK